MLATLTLVLVVLPGLGNYVQYRPVWSIRDDYLQGRHIALRGPDYVRSCAGLSEVVYGHKWFGGSQPGAGPAKDQIAFESGCSDAKSHRGNQVDDLEAALRSD